MLMNIIEILGHLGADPEVRFTTSGLKVTNLRVATNVRKKGKDETVWWRVTIWGDRFDKMITYLKKGSAVIVVGEMDKPEIYTDKEGRPQIALEMTAEFIRFSPFGKPDRPQEQGQGGHQPQHSNYESKAPEQNYGGAGASSGSFGSGFQNSGSFQPAAGFQPSGGYQSVEVKHNDSEDDMPF
jgi:single-strand DNA-binding protein